MEPDALARRRESLRTRGKPTGDPEYLLGDLKQRLRDVRVGPQGELYVLTDETDGALLKVTPGG